MKKILPLFLIILLVCPIVLADGGFYIYRDTWLLGDENQQLIAVNYENGLENMLISITVDDDIHGEKAVWIFPVPADPNEVTIDILKGFPTFYGRDIDDEYDGAVVGGLIGSIAYSTFPLGIIFFLPFTMMMGGARSLGEGLPPDGVMVHKTIEKMGLTTELITTKDQASLNQYLQGKGLNLPEDSKTIIDEYIGEEYSLVVSYISDLDKFRTEAQENRGHMGIYGKVGMPIGVFVKFPTEEIYIPMKLTSIYGSKEIPIFMYVMGHVTPKIYPKIKGDTEVKYFKQRSYMPTADLVTFFNRGTRIENLKYTQIEINTASENFVKDLWIKDSVPISIPIKEFLTKIYWVIAIILYVVFSALASWISGKISFKKDMFSKRKLMLHGLWNCLTVVGFSLATGIGMRVNKQDTALDPEFLAKIEKQGLTVTAQGSSKWKYFFLFYVFFIALQTASYIFFIIFGHIILP